MFSFTVNQNKNETDDMQHKSAFTHTHTHTHGKTDDMETEICLNREKYIYDGKELKHPKTHGQR